MKTQIVNLLQLQLQDLVVSDLNLNTFSESNRIKYPTILEMFNFIDGTIAAELTLEEVFSLIDSAFVSDVFGTVFTLAWMRSNPATFDPSDAEAIPPEYVPQGELELKQDGFVLHDDGAAIFFIVQSKATHDYYRVTHRAFASFKDFLSEDGKMAFSATKNPLISLFIQYYFWKSVAISCHPTFSYNGKRRYAEIQKKLIDEKLLSM